MPVSSTGSGFLALTARPRVVAKSAVPDRADRSALPIAAELNVSPISELGDSFCCKSFRVRLMSARVRSM